MPYASATKPGGIGPCGFMSFLLRPARGDGDAIELAVRVARQFIPPFDGPRLHEIGEILAKPGGEPLFVGGAVPAAHDQDDRGAEPRVGHAERHQDRKSVVEGKSVSGRVDSGGRRDMKKKKNK